MRRCLTQCSRLTVMRVPSGLSCRSTYAHSVHGSHVAERFPLRCLSTSASSFRKEDEPSDFVDIDMLAMMGSADPVLGVVRSEEDPEGTEYSRFAKPIDTPRQGKPLPRENSRALLQPGEEAEFFEQENNNNNNISSSSGSNEHTDTSHPSSSLVLTNDDLSEDAEGKSTLASWKDPQTLPYDDEEFAETLLKMEVDGAIDESWQDTRRAHIEDVKEITEILKSLKVRDICCIDVSGKTGSFDYMLFGTCEGSRHIHLAAWAAQEADALHRVSKIRRQQTDELWEVVPIGRIVLNLMVESLREELTLERKWAVTRSMDPLAAANAPVSEGRQVKAHGLWTLTLNLQDLEDFEVDYCKDVLVGQF